MIDTMKITVTTPTLTPRIVNAERSLLLRSVSSAIKADSLTSSNRIRFISNCQMPIADLGAVDCDKSAIGNRQSTMPSFCSQCLNRIQLRRAPRGPESANDAHDRRNSDAQYRRSHTHQQRKTDQRRDHVS